jgi:transcriptional regulator PpsR
LRLDTLAVELGATNVWARSDDGTDIETGDMPGAIGAKTAAPVALAARHSQKQSRISRPVKLFDAPTEALGRLDTEAAAALIATISDIALIVDPTGVIRDLAFSNDELSSQVDEGWIGQRWSDTVTPGTRPNVDTLLNEAVVPDQAPTWHQVDHIARNGDEMPVRYCAMRLGSEGKVVATGHNLQGLAALQQRVVDAQQSLERDYWRLRQLETRYRLLFRGCGEAVLVLDPTTNKVVEVNPASAKLLGTDTRRLVGKAMPNVFDKPGTETVQSLFAGVRSSGRPAEARARLSDGSGELTVFAAPVRQDNATLLLVRLTVAANPDQARPLAEPQSRLAQVMEQAPDGVVITSPDGSILSANAAFVEMTQLSSEEQLRGESLDRWLGRPGVDLNVLIANLRQHGAVRLFATSIRSEYGSSTEVEISAVGIDQGDRPSYGFIIRNVDRRVSPAAQPGRSLPRSLEQLTELVGRVPLKEVVRESTDLIERLCIEAALELTGDNRASAAELLGLSRQSLYVKLRRYGLSDAGAEESGG